MDENKNAPMDAASNHEHIVLENLTYERYQQMSSSERASVREAVAHQSSVVRNFSQSFLESLKDAQLRQHD